MDKKKPRGDTLTFGGKPFTVTTYEGCPGKYSLGIIVTELFDNSLAEYATLYVTEWLRWRVHG